MIGRIVGLALVGLLSLTACSGGSGERATITSPVDPTSSTTATSASTSTTGAVGERIVVSFPDPASVAGWTNVNDTVMGGVSSSTVAWGDGALRFTGRLSLENNGGFTSTVGPMDRGLGERAGGASALIVETSGDDRTYLLSVMAGPNGADRWVARFAGSASTRLPIDSFESVDRFLRPARPSVPFDPSTIVRLAVYLTDGRPGEFSLALRRIVAAD